MSLLYVLVSVDIGDYLDTPISERVMDCVRFALGIPGKENEVEHAQLSYGRSRRLKHIGHSSQRDCIRYSVNFLSPSMQNVAL